MDIEKMLEIELLYSEYSSLLTEKQRDILSMYYEEDYSLGEISQVLDISRQSVYDSLKRSETALKEYEKKLGLVKKSRKIENSLDVISEKIAILEEKILNGDSKNEKSDILTQINKSISEIKELI